MRFKTFLLALALALTASSAVSQARGKFSEIYHEEPKYIKRSSDAWRDGGRIIGEIKNTPDTLFTISIKQTADGKTLYTYKHPARLLVYQTQKIPPGTYNLTVESEGFLPYTIRNVKVFARSDCLLNLNFGTRVYDNR
ncbi:MAG: carboxypeptidase regulatory-like domain-containing protein [Victivallales bacterium]|nr:carboxypeptidase regulatory-like domain-containing protein [Victivallales bacterium]